LSARVAYVCADPGVPVLGAKGCSVHVQEVVGALRDQGADVRLLAAKLGGDGTTPEALRGVPIRALPRADQRDPAAREVALVAANKSLAKALAAIEAPDFIYERHSLWSYAAVEFAARAGIPAILEVNAPLIEEQAAHRSLVRRDLAERIAGRVFHGASAVVAVSNQVAAYGESFGAPRRRIEVIPNAVSPSRFRPDIPPSAPAAPGSFTVGFVGTLKPWHGVPVLVDAFDRLRQTHPEARLLIVGDGPESGKLEADLAARGLSAFTRFTGLVSADQVPGLLRSMDVGIAPYPALEGFYFSPLKIFEYMAAGVVVVSSDVGDLRELIRDGVTGLLVPPGDSAALAAALRRLAGEPDLRQHLARSAREYVLANHTWAGVARRVLAIAATAGPASWAGAAESLAPASAG
jgi:glycosyltransferase involved in cell wall biosynthesis